jgi:hypothetical protein
MRRGELALLAARKLRSLGFVPDHVIGRPARGGMLFLKQVFRDAPQCRSPR